VWRPVNSITSYLVVFGGAAYSDSTYSNDQTYLNDVQVLDIANKQWTTYSYPGVNS
jgi:hypothetical protein